MTSRFIALFRPVTRPLPFLALALSFSLSALLYLGAATAQDIRFMRIGTGSTSGTYFPIGSLISAALSNPPGSRPCDQGGSCGVPGLILVSQSTNGSVANVKAIQEGTIESGFSQADIAYWAYSGMGRFEGQEPMSDLRAIANLYPEAMHLVVDQNDVIFSPADLKGQRVSLDREGSGTRVGGLLVLEAFGLSPDDVQVLDLPPGAAADALAADELEAFFLIAGTPAEAVLQLASVKPVSLLPITGEGAKQLIAKYPYFTPDYIPSGVYPSVGAVETLSVGAQWLVNAKVGEELVYQLTRALWHENTRKLLDSGHPKGKLIRLETALLGLTVPLHPGAERFYREAGIMVDGRTAAQPIGEAIPQSEEAGEDEPGEATQ